MFGLLQLVLHGLAVDGSQMMFASTINVQQIDEVLPTRIERLQIVGNLFAGRELLIVRINLVLHPAEILDRLAFARVKSFDDRFALGITQLAGALGFAPRDQAPVKRSCGNHSEIQSLSRDRRLEAGLQTITRSYCLGVVSPCAGSACGEDSLDAAGSRPISRLYSSNLSCNCMS